MEKPLDIHIAAFGKTDVGLIREHNEDTFLIANTSSGDRTMHPEEVIHIPLDPKGALFLVCDGMGGAAAGEVASTMAVDSISDDMTQGEATTRERFARRLRRAIENTNEKIHLQSRINQSERGMGTTCTAVAVFETTLIVGQIGDSRCYLLRNGKLTQITKDQSLAWQLIEAGAMTLEEAKSFEHANIILQALGVQDRVEVILSAIGLRRDDLILVSSDGLHGPVTDDEIRDILVASSDPKKACEQLVERALEREGPDNITVVVAKIEGRDLPPSTPEDTVGFFPYDPGMDPADPEPPRRPLYHASDKVTEEVPIRPEVLESLSPGAIPVSANPPNLMTPNGLRANSPSESTRPLLTFVFVTLLAALCGALFLAFQPASWPDLPTTPTYDALPPAPSPDGTSLSPRRP